MYVTSEVADYVINWCHDENINITNLKLQKLLYFLQGEIFKKTGKRLISDDFYAWRLGPVIPEIYLNYAIYSSTLIPRQKPSKLLENDIKNINEILKKYAYQPAWNLVELTHAEDPWKYNYEIFGDKSIIPFDDIACYYSGENDYE